MIVKPVQGLVLRFLFWPHLLDRWRESHGRREGELSGKTLRSSRMFGEAAALRDTLYRVKLSK